MKNNITKKSQNTLKALRKKANNLKGSRFPSLKSIHYLLTDLEIEHDFQLIEGFTLRVIDKRAKEQNVWIDIDSTETYYSWNTCGHARDLCKFILNN